MSRRRELANLVGIVMPPAGRVVAIVLLWNRMVGPAELAILAVGYLLGRVGITVGYHRLFTQDRASRGGEHARARVQGVRRRRAAAPARRDVPPGGHARTALLSRSLPAAA